MRNLKKESRQEKIKKLVEEHEEFVTQIIEGTSYEKIKEYFGSKKKTDLYAIMLEKDLIKPFIKHNTHEVKAYKGSSVVNALLGAVFTGVGIATPYIGHALNSPLDNSVLGLIGLVLGFMGIMYGSCVVSNIRDAIELKDLNEDLQEEWDSLKKYPNYVKKFIKKNKLKIEDDKAYYENPRKEELKDVYSDEKYLY